jgi:hypothetical protein
MSTLTKGTFSLNLGLVQLSSEFTVEDRQCGWELYTELTTRVAVTGKKDDYECKNFDGELYIESLQSLFTFFGEARKIMRKFPVGKIATATDIHLGIIINRVIANVLRPFLEKWQVKYRHWWENESNPRLPPIERQKDFPELGSFLDDWSSLKWLMRKLKKELIDVYNLVDVDTA